MIKLPITEKELNYIIEIIKTKNPPLYAKLWAYKLNNLTGNKINGLS